MKITKISEFILSGHTHVYTVYSKIVYTLRKGSGGMWNSECPWALTPESSKIVSKKDCRYNKSVIMIAVCDNDDPCGGIYTAQSTDSQQFVTFVSIQ